MIERLLDVVAITEIKERIHAVEVKLPASSLAGQLMRAHTAPVMNSISTNHLGGSKAMNRGVLMTDDT